MSKRKWWPPEPRKKYVHIITTKTALEESTFRFSSSPKAKDFEKSSKHAINILEVKYIKKEIPTESEEGFIEE